MVKRLRLRPLTPATGVRVPYGSPKHGGVTVKKTVIGRFIVVIALVLTAAFLISACDAPTPRVPIRHVFSPGGPFSINVNDEDPRRQIRCTIVFVVVDEAAIAELEQSTFVIRNSVLSVLGEVTIPELTTDKDLPDIAQRIVDRVNHDLNSTVDLILGAYFTDIALV